MALLGGSDQTAIREVSLPGRVESSESAGHLWAVLRYVELNPVRAGMVSAPEEWPWSSIGAHCNPEIAQGILDMERWQKRWPGGLTIWQPENRKAILARLGADAVSHAQRKSCDRPRRSPS